MVFKPGSVSPAAILLDAFDLYEKKSPRADEIIRHIRPELARAVDLVVEAAGQEFEPYWQKRLLNVRKPFLSPCSCAARPTTTRLYIWIWIWIWAGCIVRSRVLGSLQPV